MKPPSLASILLGLLPAVATCFTVSLWDRIYPIVFGLPFNFFWLTLWLMLTPFCMAIAYRIESRRQTSPENRKSGGSH